MLGDTIGEMGLYLRLTEIAFVGRSLTATGGQNPLEPAMLDTAVLAGQNVQNFRDSYQKLVEGGGAKFVRDKDMLAGAVNYLLTNCRSPPRDDAGRRCDGGGHARRAGPDLEDARSVHPAADREVEATARRPMASEAPPFWWQPVDWRPSSFGRFPRSMGCRRVANA